jgi:archaellum component FlaG (FlaF/FlaG flagellin family)
MKKIFLLITSLTVVNLLSAQAQTITVNHNQQLSTDTKPATAGDFLVIKETSHDFGKIPQGKPVYYTFEIINIGKEPLKLENVQASCGCTTPEWNREAIAPGATDKIRVGYNAANEGYFEKPVTITYNSSQSKVLTIKGTVWKAPAGSAPANASVQFLKQQNQ